MAEAKVGRGKTTGKTKRRVTSFGQERGNPTANDRKLQEEQGLLPDRKPVEPFEGDLTVVMRRVMGMTRMSDAVTAVERKFYKLFEKQPSRFVDQLTGLEAKRKAEDGEVVRLKRELEAERSTVSSLKAEVERLKQEVSSLSPAVPDLSRDEAQARVEELLEKMLSEELGPDG